MRLKITILALVLLGLVSSTPELHAAGFADVYSRPIAGPSPAPRAGQLFTVWYSLSNSGTAPATGVTLTINPLTGAGVTLHSIASSYPCTGTAPIVCTIGTVGNSGGVIAVGVRYRVAISGSYPTDQYVTASNDSDPGNDTAATVVTVNP